MRIRKPRAYKTIKPLYASDGRPLWLSISPPPWVTPPSRRRRRRAAAPNRKEEPCYRLKS